MVVGFPSFTSRLVGSENYFHDDFGSNRSNTIGFPFSNASSMTRDRLAVPPQAVATKAESIARDLQIPTGLQSVALPAELDGGAERVHVPTAPCQAKV